MKNPEKLLYDYIEWAIIELERQYNLPRPFSTTRACVSIATIIQGHINSLKSREYIDEKDL